MLIFIMISNIWYQKRLENDIYYSDSIFVIILFYSFSTAAFYKV